MLLKDIRDLEGNHIADHLWFNLTKQFQAANANLNQGDRIQFDAPRRKYKKGYRGRRWEAQIECPPSVDCKLSYPTKVKIISRATVDDSGQLPNS